jgi:hypothetical protein
MNAIGYFLELTYITYGCFIYYFFMLANAFNCFSYFIYFILLATSITLAMHYLNPLFMITLAIIANGLI